MDVSQILNSGNVSDESRWLAGFINWREDFFLDKMSLNDYERKKFKDEISYKRQDIKNGTLLSSIGTYNEDLNWLFHTITYPNTEAVPFGQKYSIRNIFYLNLKNERRCLFLEIQEHKSNFKDFFLDLNNLEKTGLLCPICDSLKCTVKIVTYRDIPEKAFLTAQCYNHQCSYVNKKINELDYWNELAKICKKKEKSNPFRVIKERLKLHHSPPFNAT